MSDPLRKMLIGASLAHRSVQLSQIRQHETENTSARARDAAQQYLRHSPTVAAQANETPPSLRIHR